MIESISFERFEAVRREGGTGLSWNCLFVLPLWLEAVCRHLGNTGRQEILAVSEGGRLLGLAPLAVDADAAFFLGSPDVCDYQDIVAAPGREADLLAAVCAHLAQQGVRRLSLGALRPDSAAMSGLKRLEERRALRVRRISEAVSYETDLACDWEAYLERLSGKQRHEVRRKFRRLENSGDVAFSLAGESLKVSAAAKVFLDLFGRNRRDKADFMTDRMAAYFMDLIGTTAREGMLKLYILSVSGAHAAAVLCFDYQGTRYLYNNSYDDAYRDLSVGILSKIISIRKGIESGCRKYDFLKGGETYKVHLGGIPVPLYRCEVDLQASD